MPEPVSIGAFCIAGYAVLNAYGRGRNAVSLEAREAQDAAIAIVEHAERSQSLFGEKGLALSALHALQQECREDNWDGNNSAALDPIAVGNAQNFLRALPPGIPMPEFSPEPDGSISLDWIASRTQMFSLSVGTSHRLAFAWLDGTDKGHGVAQFSAQQVPLKILEGIRSVTKDVYASLRAA